GGYSAKQAVRVCRRAEDLDVRWLEEPVSSDHLEQLREVRTQVAPDVTAGEYGTDSFYFRRMCAADALDCLQVDATRCGGYTGWLRAVAIAAAYGLDVSAHCAPHLHAPVAAATPGLRHIEWFHDHQRIESMFFDGIGDVHDGRLTPQTSVPGLGYVLREPDTEQFRVA
ncbi:MAG: enolase C-terminal domain-like protein, partial [Nocardioidaceae bacterium]